jgi:signal transduction histidine kinase/ligand-binding sensor domain-containing protein/AraC-like DNA-binding protein
MKSIPKYHLIVLLFSLILQAIACYGQYESLRFERLTIEDGLPNPSALDIIQDRQGFIWIGTLSGIVRYDGYEMKTYLPEASTIDSLPSRNIPNFYEDKSGTIWAGFQYSHIWPKLYRYDTRLDDFVPCLFDPGLDTNIIGRGISCLWEDRLGRLLAGTWGDGLYAIDIGKEKNGIAPKDLSFKHFLHHPGDGTSLCNDAIGKGWSEDGEGNIWMPTDNGLCKFIPGDDRFETFRFTTDTVHLGNEYTVTLFEKPHTLWVGSILHGLLVFDLKEEKFVKQYQHDPADPWSIAPDAVWKIIKIKDGNFWLGVNGRMDIFNRETERFTHIKDDSHNDWSPSFPWNNALIEDYSGNIWAATWQNGVYKFNPGMGRFSFLRPGDTGMPGVRHLWAQCEDGHGDVWFITEKKGLLRLNRTNGTFHSYRHQPGNPRSISSDEPSGIVLAADGGLWIGSDAGLDKMDAAGRVVNHYQPFPEGEETNLFISKNGSVWAWSWAKPYLCLLTDPVQGTFKCYPSTQGDPGAMNSIVAIEEDERGRLWLGTNQAGLYVFDPVADTLAYFAGKFGVHGIHFDRYGNCWLVTHSAGLKLFDRATKSVISINREASEKLGIVQGIQEDREGYLWMKTPRGIAQFDPQKRKVMRFFSSSQWLNPGESWYSRGSIKTGSGEFFFDSPSGVLYFHPDSVGLDSIPPKVAITEFMLFNEAVRPGKGSPLTQDISHTKKVKLAHWQNDISLHFAALHFKIPEENKYLFRLDPRDSEWFEAGQDRTAVYTNLPPGSYTFRLKASNSDGIWSGETTLQIGIGRAWWNTWWARALFAGLVILALFAIREFELRRKMAKAEARRLTELDAVKSKLYTNITHEFRTPLTIILGLAGQIKAQASESMKSSLDIINRNGHQLLRLVNQILDLSKLESGFLKLDMKQGDVVGYLRYLTESFHSFAKHKKISLHFVSERKALVMDFDPGRLQQIVNNLLSNALKFTPPGGAVTVTAGKEGGSIVLKVSDTGTGISKENLSRIFDRFFQATSDSYRGLTRSGEGAGIGLALTRELVKLMSGEIFAVSEQGKGTTFVVALPVTNEAEAFSWTEFRETDDAWPVPSAPAKPSRLRPKEVLPGAPLVLIVEDNADVVAYLASCLEGKYRIAVAKDGQQGIDRAIELVPDLVVSDVMMPEKDGFEVCRFLKNDERTSHIPVILLTAKADDSSRLTGLGRGADAYLAKPFNPEELLIRARKLLELRRNLQTHYLRLSGLTEQAGSPQPGAPAEPSEQAFVKKVREIIEANLDDSLYAVPALCKELLMSRTQLHRKLTSLTGRSANRFIRLVRLAKAKEMLAENELAITEIAYQTGFSTPGYFSKVFKKETGLSPREYREQA